MVKGFAPTMASLKPFKDTFERRSLLILPYLANTVEHLNSAQLPFNGANTGWIGTNQPP
jgi:hypothetical protein